MADAYTDACHAMRRGKTAIKAIVLGFSLPVASFSYPARKKSLILRLLLPELSIFAAGQKDRRLWVREWVLTKRSAAPEEENVYIALFQTVKV